jgi:hypothetical protein
MYLLSFNIYSAKTSAKRSFSIIENERFGLVFAKTGSINLATGVLKIVWSPSRSNLPNQIKIQFFSFHSFRAQRFMYTYLGKIECCLCL